MRLHSRYVFQVGLFFFISCLGAQESRNFQFDEVSTNDSLCDFIFPNTKNDSQLYKLRKRYHLEELVKNQEKQIEKTMVLLQWAHTRFKHDGNNAAESYDPLFILSKAEEGERFRCVEYGITISAVLNSLGMPSRILGLKTHDVETNTYGTGHVASEVYLYDLKKWVFVDAQMNYVPFLEEVPLNAVEYKKAILSNKDKIQLRNMDGLISKRKAKKMINWVSKYLFYIDISFDSTMFDASKERKKCQGKTRLMLVPLNAKEPKIFQATSPLDYFIYTHNLKDFYKKPLIKG